MQIFFEFFIRLNHRALYLNRLQKQKYESYLHRRIPTFILSHTFILGATAPLATFSYFCLTNMVHSLKKYSNRLLAASLPLLLTLILSGCFTGIESTKKIEITGQDRRLLEPSPEEQLLSQVGASPLSEWKKGKAFVVADTRAGMVLSSDVDTDSLSAGELLLFNGISPILMPDGREYALLQWDTPSGKRFRYNTGKVLQEAASGITSDRIPFLVDAGMIAEVDSILRNRPIWNRSSMAYRPDGDRISILKFSRLEIDSVTVGQSHFPLKAWTTLPASSVLSRGNLGTASDSLPVYFYLDFNSSLAESRPLSRLFSLSDPRLSYPAITEPVWEAIRHGKVLRGMTKDECRLSLGNPSDANSGHDYNSTIDIWQYPDGTFLRFIDGLLDSYRK